MNNRQINFYQFKGGKPPFYFFPLMVLLVLVVVGILAVFGLFAAIAVAIGVIVLSIMRLFNSFGKKKSEPVTSRNDGEITTITLEEKDYEIIEKDK